MGDPNGGQSERPVRSVQLTQPFAVSKYEVGVEDFLRYTQHKRRDSPKETGQSAGRGRSHNPKPGGICVTSKCHKVCPVVERANWCPVPITYRSRVGIHRASSSSSAYFFGEEPQQLCQHANVADQTLKKRYRAWEVIDCNDGQEGPENRGQYQPNAFGLYDTHGSVSEWVADCGMPDYAKASRDGTKEGEGAGRSSHGHRGGSWDSGPEDTKNSYRKAATGGNADRGIRLLREL